MTKIILALFIVFIMSILVFFWWAYELGKSMNEGH